MKEVEGLYYLCSENKGADQLRGQREADRGQPEADRGQPEADRGQREADLRLCFRICRKQVFSW